MIFPRRLTLPVLSVLVLVFLTFPAFLAPALAARPETGPAETFTKIVQSGYEFYLSPARPAPGQALILFCRPADDRDPGFSQVVFAGRKFPLERVPGGQLTVVAIPLDTAPGSQPIKCEVATPGGWLELKITVVPHDYGVQKLTLPKSMVTPMRPETLKKIQHDRQLLRKVYASSGNRLLLARPVEPPLKAPLTSTFGLRRVLNGKPKSPHGGIDYKAKIGVPVPAAADGRVVLAENLYYSGNLVIIDHGLDIFTLYMHLSKFNCRAGQSVSRGQIIGYSGRSGRVTGPHLHWGVKINGVFVDPLEFARLSRLLLQPPWKRPVPNHSGT